MLFMSAFGGLIDTITLEYCYSKKVAYGPIRLAGTLFYGIIAFMLSLYIKDNIRLIFPVYIALAAVTCVSMFFIPKIPGMASTK